jgi:DNA-binding MarR family transcriptional regulator
MRDTVDAIADQWAQVRPDLDVSPMRVVGRMSRASRLLERGNKAFFTDHGIEAWEFDVLATLRRAGPPHTLCSKDIVATAMIGSPALTNRIDRLVAKGLVTRETDPNNRRQVRITLTPEGLRIVDDLVEGHMDNESRQLRGLTSDERLQLASLLRKLLVSVGDGQDTDDP